MSLSDEERMAIELDCIAEGDYVTSDWIIDRIERGYLNYVGAVGTEKHTFALTKKGLFKALASADNDGIIFRQMFAVQVQNSLRLLGVPEWLV